MRSTVAVGVRILEASVEESDELTPEEVRASEANVLRLTNADSQAAAERGFLTKPTWINWLAMTADGSDDLLSLQSKRHRNRTRGSQRALARLRHEVHEPIDVGALDAWLPLYDRQVKRLDRGVNFARKARSMLLTADSGHMLLTWYNGERPVCGCVVKQSTAAGDESVLHVRFSAIDPTWRDEDLLRGMFAHVADLVGARGCGWVSAGNDPNLYGGLAPAGLCAYKLRLGFRPVPSELLYPSMSTTVVERVLTVENLMRPAAVFAYRDHDTTQRSLAAYMKDTAPEPFELHAFVDDAEIQTDHIPFDHVHRMQP